MKNAAMAEKVAMPKSPQPVSGEIQIGCRREYTAGDWYGPRRQDGANSSDPQSRQGKTISDDEVRNKRGHAPAYRRFIISTNMVGNAA
jgi:hypothetical protein